MIIITGKEAIKEDGDSGNGNDEDILGIDMFTLLDSSYKDKIIDAKEYNQQDETRDTVADGMDGYAKRTAKKEEDSLHQVLHRIACRAIEKDLTEIKAEENIEEKHIQ